MAVVPVTINCVIFPKVKGGSVPQPYPATIVGNAWLTGLSVGGGPIEPDTPPPIEPGLPGKPTFPIWGPPGIELPPGAGYPPVAGHPLPEPPNGGLPPDPPTVVKPPPPEGGWGYSPTYGWGYFPGPGQPGPKK